MTMKRVEKERDGTFFKGVAVGGCLCRNEGRGGDRHGDGRDEIGEHDYVYSSECCQSRTQQVSDVKSVGNSKEKGKAMR